MDNPPPHRELLLPSIIILLGMGIAADVGLLVIHLYFFTVHVVFVVINLFIKKEHVPAPVDTLVMLSATEAVKKIRRREVSLESFCVNLKTTGIGIRIHIEFQVKFCQFQIRPSQLVEAYIHRIEQVR